MNTILKYILFSILFVLSSCSGEDVFVTNGQSPREALVLTVSVGDFVTDGNSATRAADTGATTTFENNDKVGVIILDGKGTLLSNNVPYKYNNGSWSFENIDSKTQCYYDSKAVTYIVYYPYSTDANDVINVDGLKSKFKPKDDQSTEADYRASDLLVWTSTSGPLKTLTAELKHAYASVSVSPNIKYTLQDGNSTEVICALSQISDVSLAIEDNSAYKFYPAEDGSYRYILPTNSSISNLSCSFTFKSKEYSSTVTISTSVSANTRYTFVPTVKGGDYGLDKAQIGDFYCKSNDGNTGYLIPSDIASLTAEQKAACLGVVLKAGRGTDEGKTGNDDKEANNWKDDCDYKQKDSQNPMSDIHGYVLALNDANGGNDCQWGSSGTQVHTDQNQYSGFYGYKNTQTIKAVAADKTLVDAFPAAYYTTAAYEDSYASPVNSSGWFLPSAGQCWYWFKNGDVLLSSMKKASGNENYSWKSYYWSSSERNGGPAYNAWSLDFNRSDVSGYFKDGDRYVRSCLAF